MGDERITTGFGADSTADDVVAGSDLGGLRVVVTGASSGLGVETARSLVRAGAEVVLAVRNPAAGAEASASIAGTTGRSAPEVRVLDLADPGSADAFASAWSGPLHVLIANAGVVTAGLVRTPEGRELQMATNHLGHLRLAIGLHDALVAGAADRDGARIVSLTSGAHLRAPVDLDDLDHRATPYDPQIAYARSKTADVLFTVEATRRWAGDGVVANAANPGGIRTGLQRDFTQQQRDSLDAAEAAGVFAYRTPQQGAATTLVAAVAPELAGVGGRYLDDCREAETVDDDVSMMTAPHGVKRWALDPATARELWRRSTALTGLPD